VQGRDARGGWQEWSWDPSLFEGSAPFYDRGRFPYAEGLDVALAAALGLDPPEGRLLDVGCGPGKFTFEVAHVFVDVVGLDPDEGMLTEATRLAAERGVDNATWVRLRAEDLPAGLGRFRAVTFAASLHWLDRPRVFATVRSMLDRDGAVVHVDNQHQDIGERDRDLPHPPPPASAMDELVRRYLGRDRRAGQGIRNTSPGDEDDVFRAAGFRGPELTVVADGRVLERTVDDEIASRLSASSSAPHLFGDRLDDYVRDLRALLVAASPSGRFGVRLPDNVLRVWRPR
jgi:ubiquinone/menaquinone biosynthesis C-methylase UbiE